MPDRRARRIRHSLPQTGNLAEAERYYLEREALRKDINSKYQTAMFYFYVLQNFQRVLDKMNEIDRKDGDRSEYYSALALKGLALSKVGKVSDSESVLDEMLTLINLNPEGLPYGDEINFWS